MKSRVSRFAIVGGAAAAALVAGTISASAVSATYTVKAGSAKTGTTVPIKGTTTGASPQITFKDTTANLTLSCASGTAAGSTKVGSGKPAAKLGTINGPGSKFNTCSGPFGLKFVVTGVNTWNINATGTTKSGTTPASITNITANVKDGTSCSFVAKGTVPGSFKNGGSSSQLILPGTSSQLTLSNVTGSLCATAGIKNGDKSSFKATYILKATTAAYNPVTVTSS